MRAKKKDNMNRIEITNIIERVKSGSVSEDDLGNIQRGLRLLKVAKETLIDGDEIHAKDLQEIGPSVGKRLKDARKGRRFSQEQLETKSKISQSTISKIENGSKMISVEEAKSLGKALGIKPQFLIAGIK